MKLTGRSILNRFHNLYISDFFSKCHMRSGQSSDFTIISQLGNMKTVIFALGTWSHALHVLSCTPCKVRCFTFELWIMRDVIYDVTRDINSFSSITPDQIELESRETHQWTLKYLPNRMICHMAFFISFVNWAPQTWPHDLLPKIESVTWST